MDQDRLATILKNHKLWLEGNTDKNWADLWGADLRKENLRWANLRGADLWGANLWGADLLGADLSGADLRCTNLRGTNLMGADLRKTKYGVLNLLQTNWGNLSDTLTLELMRHDAELCRTEAMNNWALSGGSCPFSDMERGFHFVENKEIWKPGSPRLRGIELLLALANEKEISL